MKLEPAPFRSPLPVYEQQAGQLLAGHRAADKTAIDLFHRTHPRFLDENVKWRPKFISDDAIRDTPLSLDDARLAVARYYDLADWASLVAWVEAVAQDGPVFEFEAAVEAVINGERIALKDALRRSPTLIRARSTRVCNADPPVHRATLLHYVAANGVETYRQKTPPNAVDIARLLLEAGAEPDALADMYGAGCTTMSILVSSSPPRDAGVQASLVELLLDFGAAVEGRGTRKWDGPLQTAVGFGMIDAANVLVRRGARIDLTAAAGLGLLDEVRGLLPTADAAARHRAFSLAAQQGHAEIVRLLLDAGEDPNRFNLEGNHAHSTPLHQAVIGGHQAVVRLLVDRGARLDIRDTIWQATPLGWAIHGGGKASSEMAACLRSLGAAQ
jgi:ankyrin repeat protein